MGFYQQTIKASQVTYIIVPWNIFFNYLDNKHVILNRSDVTKVRKILPFILKKYFFPISNSWEKSSNLKNKRWTVTSRSKTLTDRKRYQNVKHGCLTWLDSFSPLDISLDLTWFGIYGNDLIWVFFLLKKQPNKTIIILKRQLY